MLNESTEDLKLSTKEENVGMSMINPLTKDTYEPEDLRKKYLQNFGVSMEIPAYYIYDARFVPHVKDYIVTLTWHILPKSFTSTVQTTYLNGTVTDSNF